MKYLLSLNNYQTIIRLSTHTTHIKTLKCHSFSVFSIMHSRMNSTSLIWEWSKQHQQYNIWPFLWVHIINVNNQRGFRLLAPNCMFQSCTVGFFYNIFTFLFNFHDYVGQAKDIRRSRSVWLWWKEETRGKEMWREERQMRGWHFLMWNRVISQKPLPFKDACVIKP